MAEKENLLNTDKDEALEVKEDVQSVEGKVSDNQKSDNKKSDSKKSDNKKSNNKKSDKNENAKSKNKKSDKPSFFAKLAKKFKGLKGEFKKITWANVRTTFKNFGIVIVALIIFGTAIGLVDYGLGSLFQALINL